MMPNDTDTYLETIEDFVDAYRKKYKVVPSDTPLLELSEFAHGEGTTLLYRRIIPGYDWKSELKANSVLLQMVYDQVEKDREKLGLGEKSL